MLKLDEFIQRHKVRPEDFVRDRVLQFGIVLSMILQKSAKSLQIRLNELLLSERISKSVSASAFSQARHKFKHTAFIELDRLLVESYYSEKGFKTWRGYRCIGVDGSKTVLPLTKEVETHFGRTVIKNAYGEKHYVWGLWECYYDVLNHVVIKTELNPSWKAEREAALELLDTGGKKDLLIWDRGYASYEFLVKLKENKKDYVIRCPKRVFAEADRIFAQGKEVSQVIEIQAPNYRKKEVVKGRLPEKIRVRLVGVKLSTGELEVLVSSLGDPVIGIRDFKELYFLRWGVEGFFDLVKNRLNLENYTGKSLESVYQDFWSTILISNLETLLTEETENELMERKQGNKYKQKVNKAVSFNAIKNLAFELLDDEEIELEEVLEKLAFLFKMSPTVVRPDRNLPRKRSCRRSEHFLRRIKKAVF